MTPVSIDPRDDGVLDVILRGEIDYTNAAPVTQTVTDAVDRVRPVAVRVDLTEVTFLDSSGIGALASGSHTAQTHGIPFTTRQASPFVVTQLRTTGLYDALTGER